MQIETVTFFLGGWGREWVRGVLPSYQDFFI
jgi:hypothetical protein